MLLITGFYSYMVILWIYLLLNISMVDVSCTSVVVTCTVNSCITKHDPVYMQHLHNEDPDLEPGHLCQLTVVFHHVSVPTTGLTVTAIGPGL